MIDLGNNEGIELGLWDGKVLGTTLGAIDGLSLGTYYGTELGWLESSTDRAADGKPKGLLLGACLG